MSAAPRPETSPRLEPFRLRGANFNLLVLRLLEKDPSGRPASAEEVRREISRVKRLLSRSAPAIDPVAESSELAEDVIRRSRAPFVVAGVLALAAMLGVGAWAVFS